MREWLRHHPLWSAVACNVIGWAVILTVKFVVWVFAPSRDEVRRICAEEFQKRQAGNP